MGWRCHCRCRAGGTGPAMSPVSVRTRTAASRSEGGAKWRMTGWTCPTRWPGRPDDGSYGIDRIDGAASPWSGGPWCSTGMPRPTWRDLPGIAVRWADCRFAFWNCVTLTEVDADAALVARRLGQAAEIMRAKKHPGFLWLFEDLLGDEARGAVRTAAERAGLAVRLPGTGMAGDLPAPPRTGPPRADVRPVTTEEQLEAYADLNSRAPTASRWRTAATGCSGPRCGRTRCTPTWGCGTASR